MKPHYRIASLRRMCAALLLIPFMSCVAPSARAQIFVTNYNGSTLIESYKIGDPGNNGTIGDYNFDGTAINSAIVSGLNGPKGIAFAGGEFFVLNYYDGFLGQYSISGTVLSFDSLVQQGPFATGIRSRGSSLFVLGGFGTVASKIVTSGASVDFGSITGLSAGVTNGIAVSGDGTRLFIANFDNGSIGQYDAVTGAAINAVLISSLSSPTAIAIADNELFVANSGNGTISEYLLDGTPVNTALVTGLSNPLDLAVFEGHLYVVNNGTNSVGEYDATTGATINANLITGLSDPQGIAVVPEPAAWLLAATALASLFAFRRRFSTKQRSWSLTTLAADTFSSFQCTCFDDSCI